MCLEFCRENRSGLTDSTENSLNVLFLLPSNLMPSKSNGWVGKEKWEVDLTSFTLPLVSNSEKIFDRLRCENEYFYNYLWISFILITFLFLACPGLYYLYYVFPPLPGK